MASKGHIKPFRNGSDSGQAAVEYLLTLGGVFIAFAGASILFGSVFRRILKVLSVLVCNAFYQ